MKFTKEEWSKIRVALFVVAASLVLFAILQNVPTLGKIFGTALGILTPFIIALCIAFLVNIPMGLIENKMLSFLPLSRGIKRFLAMILSFILIGALFYLLFSIVLPQLIQSVRTFVFNVPPMLQNLENYVSHAKWLGPLADPIQARLHEINNMNIISYITSQLDPNNAEWVNSMLGNVFSTLSTVFSSFMTGILALIFSIYMLGSKEELSLQSKGLLYTFLPEKTADNMMYVVYTAYDNFYNFFTGQFMEAVMLGVMTFIGMTILGFHYAIVISMIISLGALVPMVGAIIAAFIGFLMLLTTSPLEAISYLVYVIVLQQFDGNLIYPKIVGQSVGLPAIWVLFAITVGGSLMGILGMLIFVPIVSTIYDIVSDFKTRRLMEKRIQVYIK